MRRRDFMKASGAAATGVMVGGAGLGKAVEQAAASTGRRGRKTVKNTTAGQIQKQKKVYDAHRQYVKIHFDDSTVDFAFQWILGSTRNGGCEIGEAFYAAGRMGDGHPRKWESEWLAMAQRVAKVATDSFKGGHKLSAREAWLRAANYYRAMLVTMNPTKPDCKKIGNTCRSTFKKAAALFDPPIECIEIPFEGTVLPGYFIKAHNRNSKTLIMIGGGETITEDLYYYIAPETIKRGYNFLTVDLPGQGLLPYEGKYFRHDTEVPLKAVVDYALGRREVDPKRLAMYGISGGGYYVPRAATFDQRIKAIIVNSAVVDGYKLFRSMDFSSQTPQEIKKKWSAFKQATFGVTAWRYGLKPSNIKGLAEVNKGHVYDPAKITCPALVLIGEGEYANPGIRRQQEEFMKGVSSSTKKFVLTHQNEGASSHCLSENRSLMSQIVFDWLDEVFS